MKERDLSLLGGFGQFYSHICILPKSFRIIRFQIEIKIIFEIKVECKATFDTSDLCMISVFWQDHFLL